MNRHDIPIVDCHHHFWRLDRVSVYYPWLSDDRLVHFRYGDYSRIRRDYLPADYRRDHGRYRVVKSVHEEAWSDPRHPLAETRWLDDLAARSGAPDALVGAAWLGRDDVEEVLAGHAASPLARGIRNFPAAGHDAPEPSRGETGTMDDAKWRLGFSLLERHGFSADIQAPWRQFDALARVAADFPRTQVVIVHTGLPVDRSEEGLSGWRKALERVAVHGNVAIKISGLGEAGKPWTLQTNGRIIRDVIAVFGVDRCMFASNFPVDRVVGTFETIYDGFHAAIAELSPQDKRKLFHDNAARIYRL